MNVFESVWMAIDSIRSNKLRAFLTLLSISIGVFAIIGAGTAVNSLNSTIDDQLATLGENTYTIQQMPAFITSDAEWHKYAKRKPITYDQASEFEKLAEMPQAIGIFNRTGGIVAKFGNLQTDPDVWMLGANDGYFNASNYTVKEGRTFTKFDIQNNGQVAMLGNDVVVKIFPNVNPIGKTVLINNYPFEVIGVMKPLGGMFGQSQDNNVVVPISYFLKYFANEDDASMAINVKAPSRLALNDCIDETIGIMRTLRNLKPWEANSFEVVTNEAIGEQFASFTNYIAYFGFICGFVALIAAGVGIMNIMLVSVKERTREIGVRKAIGAKKSWILAQFLIESITLCLIGALIGVAMGVIVGGILSSMGSMHVSVPVSWVIVSVLLCSMIGAGFGGYPAWKAANLDPIDALRYE